MKHRGTKITSPGGDGMIHENSLEAYNALDLGPRQKSVLQVYQRYIEPLTDRKVLSVFTGNPWGDLNKVQPRITELIKMGFLEEKGKTKCPYTAVRPRNVRLVGLL